MNPLLLPIHSTRLGAPGFCAALFLWSIGVVVQNLADAVLPQAVVNLQASATVEVAKDVLFIAMTTTRYGADVVAVQTALKQALGAALLEAKRVTKPRQLDVQTGNFSLSPRCSKGGKVSGWLGSAELLIEGRDMAAVGQLTGLITRRSAV